MKQTICCPKCKSENIRVRIATDGTVDCIECYDCHFEDWARGDKRKHPDSAQWKEVAA